MIKKIAVIGDSHSIFFAGAEGIKGLKWHPAVPERSTCLHDVRRFESIIPNFDVFHVGSALAFHLNRYGTKVQAREKVDALLERGIIQEGQPILCSFGEIDLRVHVLQQAEKQKKNVSEIIDEILHQYIEFLMLLQEKHAVYVWGPIPTQQDGSKINPQYPYYGTMVERNKATAIFNEKLETLCAAHGIGHVSIYRSLIDDRYQTKEAYIADGCHLSQMAWRFAVDEFRRIGVDICFSGEWGTRVLYVKKENVKKMEQAKVETADIPKIETEILNHVKAMEEFQYVERIRAHFRVMDVEGEGKFLRAGRFHDGGYVMWDDLADIKIAYSIGIDGDVSWDLDMAKRGIQVYMYDHTIKAPTETCPKFRFFCKGLAGVWSPEHPELETLPRLIEQNGHTGERNMLLKMDIEGSERSVLREIDLDTLRRFSQIIIEFHGFCNSKYENELAFGLDKLNAIHQLVHVHGNNHKVFAARGGKILPDVLEATYLRRSDHQFKASTRCFPTSLDSPNAKGRPDILLGYWG